MINGCLPAYKASTIYRSMPSIRSISNLDLDITEACNLACIYCFKWQKRAVHMDIQMAKAAVDWLIEASGRATDLKVNFMGGEPLIRFDLIKELVPYGKVRARQSGKSIHFGCTTNCTLVNDEIIAFWRSYGMGFHCSIDGIPKIQNQNRPKLSGGESSGAVELGARKILAYRPEVMARATVTPESTPYIYESAEYIRGLGFRNITFRVAANAAWSAEAFATLREGYSKVVSLYLKSLFEGRRLKIEELAKGIAAMHSTKPLARTPCGAGRGMVLMDPRGDMWPCHRFGPNQGNGQFLFGALGGAFNDSVRQRFLDFDVWNLHPNACDHCPALPICRSWCYAECIDATGSMDCPSPNHCEYVKIIHEQVVAMNDYLRAHRPDILRALVTEEV